MGRFGIGGGVAIQMLVLGRKIERLESQPAAVWTLENALVLALRIVAKHTLIGDFVGCRRP
jgi:hypothetical protein